MLASNEGVRHLGETAPASSPRSLAGLQQEPHAVGAPVRGPVLWPGLGLVPSPPPVPCIPSSHPPQGRWVVWQERRQQRRSPTAQCFSSSLGFLASFMILHFRLLHDACGSSEIPPWPPSLLYGLEAHPFAGYETRLWRGALAAFAERRRRICTSEATHTALLLVRQLQSRRSWRLRGTAEPPERDSAMQSPRLR